ncbi:hypothetical protein SLEP1_g44766 [Rubroshorea leprosula]|uniref:RNase H type-1 domain-containing protein n=1 Tax=Rubroshorea leprosula TaxID=152421 RepID=A0AAV5LHP4_9ROSI|nr:hypothetical protein SLEP1_g44766 [Rubroshorea leprosula]
MTLNPLKRTFVVKSDKFLGYVVSKNGIEVNPDKVEAVQQMEPLKTIKDVQRLTGRLVALHRFITRSVEKCLLFFRALREPKNFQWTDECQQAFDECQQAFDELKQYLVSPPLLSKPIKGEKLYLYLRITDEAKPELSSRLIGWAIELSEYDLKFQPRTTIKGQALADFLVECHPTVVEEATPSYPVWALYIDGAANVEGSRVGAVLMGPDGFKSRHTLRFKFQTTNNTAEYEALIYGLKLASKLKAQSIRIFSDSQLVVNQVNGSCDIRDPQLNRYASMVNRIKSSFISFQIDKILRADNRRADELSKLASSQDINPQRTTFVEVLDALSYTNLAVECQVLSTNPSSPT